jgi:hypothetical protein
MSAFDVAIGVKRTWLVVAHMSAFDPKRTCCASRSFRKNYVYKTGARRKKIRPASQTNERTQTGL